MLNALLWLAKAIGRPMSFLFGFMVLAGFLSLLFSVVAFFSTLNFIRGSTVTEGRVVSLVSHVGKRNPAYSPEVEYTVHSRTYRIEGRGQTYPSLYHVGQQVRVRYRISNPAEAAIDTPFQVWTNFILFLLFGALFFLIPLGVLYVLVRLGKLPPRARPHARTPKKRTRSSTATPTENQ